MKLKGRMKKTRPPKKNESNLERNKFKKIKEERMI